MEPLLFTFQAPRTIAATLFEYEEHLRHERSLSPRRVRAMVRTLERFLDPLEAPLVALIPELARTLIRENEQRSRLTSEPGAPSHGLTLARARRFFRWAVQQGYIGRNPFEEFEVGVVVEKPTSWLA